MKRHLRPICVGLGLTLALGVHAAPPPAFLAGPTAGSPREIAEHYLSSHRQSIGLQQQDLSQMRLADREGLRRIAQYAVRQKWEVRRQNDWCTSGRGY